MKNSKSFLPIWDYPLFLHGGPDGEIGASMRYLSQRYSMPYKQGKGLLTDIGTEASKLPERFGKFKTKGVVECERKK